jgi:transglutaminase-like putative cysteine protease
MNRREFLQASGAICAAAVAVPHDVRERASGWRIFEIITRVEVLQPQGTTRVWVPTPLTISTPYQKPIHTTFAAPGGHVTRVDRAEDGLGIVYAQFSERIKPIVTVNSRVATLNHAVALAKPSDNRELPLREREHFLRATKLLPTDGLVRETALKITRNTTSDLDKARAIYDWIVENTFRDASVRGCGLGDIRTMIQLRNFGGKCADLNALFVGLARSVGLPARDVYGVRAARSALGYASLGVKSTDVTKAQHCRAEVYLRGFGWVPVDPADVRKVILEEPPGHLSPDSEMVTKARERLFGSWEMNWIAYNFAHDVPLPDSQGAPLAFFMYPQAETRAGRLDSLSPESFKYEITALETA